MSELELLKRIDTKLTNLLNKKVKETWVNVAVIKELTGWQGSNKLRAMREGGAVIYNKETDKYLLESLNKIFIKHNNN